MRDEELTEAVKGALFRKALNLEMIFESALIVSWKAKTYGPSDQLIERDDERRLTVWQWRVEAEIKRLRSEGRVKPSCGVGFWALADTLANAGHVPGLSGSSG